MSDDPDDSGEGPDRTVDPTDEQFDADLSAAAEMLAGDDVDGFFAGVVRDDELDYAFGHRFDDPETVGTQALALAAKHLQAIAAEAEVPVEQVADDAASFAVAFDGE
jgi:predicted secreted protein